MKQEVLEMFWQLSDVIESLGPFYLFSLLLLAYFFQFFSFNYRKTAASAPNITVMFKKGISGTKKHQRLSSCAVPFIWKQSVFQLCETYICVLLAKTKSQGHLWFLREAEKESIWLSSLSRRKLQGRRKLGVHGVWSPNNILHPHPLWEFVVERRGWKPYVSTLLPLGALSMGTEC